MSAMKPQTGDIWRYNNLNPYRKEENLVLLHELLHDGPGHFSGKQELTFWGYDLLTDQYDEFIFNDSNMPHWTRQA